MHDTNTVSEKRQTYGLRQLQIRMGEVNDELNNLLSDLKEVGECHPISSMEMTKTSPDSEPVAPSSRPPLLMEELDNQIEALFRKVGTCQRKLTQIKTWTLQG